MQVSSQTSLISLCSNTHTLFAFVDLAHARQGPIREEIEPQQRGQFYHDLAPAQPLRSEECHGWALNFPEGRQQRQIVEVAPVLRRSDQCQHANHGNAREKRRRHQLDYHGYQWKCIGLKSCKRDTPRARFFVTSPRVLQATESGQHWQSPLRRPWMRKTKSKLGAKLTLDKHW